MTKLTHYLRSDHKGVNQINEQIDINLSEKTLAGYGYQVKSDIEEQVSYIGSKNRQKARLDKIETHKEIIFTLENDLKDFNISYETTTTTIQQLSEAPNDQEYLNTLQELTTQKGLQEKYQSNLHQETEELKRLNERLNNIVWIQNLPKEKHELLALKYEIERFTDKKEQLTREEKSFKSIIDEEKRLQEVIERNKKALEELKESKKSLSAELEEAYATLKQQEKTLSHSSYSEKQARLQEVTDELKRKEDLLDHYKSEKTKEDTNLSHLEKNLATEESNFNYNQLAKKDADRLELIYNNYVDDVIEEVDKDFKLPANQREELYLLNGFKLINKSLTLPDDIKYVPNLLSALQNIKVKAVSKDGVHGQEVDVHEELSKIQEFIDETQEEFDKDEQLLEVTKSLVSQVLYKPIKDTQQEVLELAHKICQDMENRAQTDNPLNFFATYTLIDGSYEQAERVLRFANAFSETENNEGDIAFFERTLHDETIKLLNNKERDKNNKEGDAVDIQEVIEEFIDPRSWYKFSFQFEKDGNPREELTTSNIKGWSQGQLGRAYYEPLIILLGIKMRKLGESADAPNIIVMDEIFSGVDHKQVAHLLAMIKEIGNTQVIATGHNAYIRPTEKGLKHIQYVELRYLNQNDKNKGVYLAETAAPKELVTLNRSQQEEYII